MSRDHYGGHAADYRKFRPTYPESLYTQILGLAPCNTLAWDCGTGSGQVAFRLAQDFEQVLATDLSQKQLREADQHPRVSYREAEAHNSGLADNSVSLITVGTAVHWFDQSPFYTEASRVLIPGGLLAVWTYSPNLIAPDSLADVVEGLSQELDSDWPRGIEWVQREYSDLPFPFPPLELEPFEFSVTWSPDDLLGWISTWSAVHRHRKRTGKEPLDGVRQRIERAWPGPLKQPARLVLPLHYKVGQKA
jgi:SAM-dependent methyltransferase